MLQKISSVFVVYRHKTLTGSPDPTHANGTDKPCTDTVTYPLTMDIRPASPSEICWWQLKLVHVRFPSERYASYLNAVLLFMASCVCNFNTCCTCQAVTKAQVGFNMRY